MKKLISPGVRTGIIDYTAQYIDGRFVFRRIQHGEAGSNLPPMFDTPPPSTTVIEFHTESFTFEVSDPNETDVVQVRMLSAPRFARLIYDPNLRSGEVVLEPTDEDANGDYQVVLQVDDGYSEPVEFVAPVKKISKLIVDAGADQMYICDEAAVMLKGKILTPDPGNYTVEWEQITNTHIDEVILDTPTALDVMYTPDPELRCDKTFRMWVNRGTDVEVYDDVSVWSTLLSQFKAPTPGFTNSSHKLYTGFNKSAIHPQVSSVNEIGTSTLHNRYTVEFSTYNSPDTATVYEFNTGTMLWQGTTYSNLNPKFYVEVYANTTYYVEFRKGKYVHASPLISGNTAIDRVAVSVGEMFTVAPVATYGKLTSETRANTVFSKRKVSPESTLTSPWPQATKSTISSIRRFVGRVYHEIADSAFNSQTPSATNTTLISVTRLTGRSIGSD